MENVGENVVVIVFGYWIGMMMIDADDEMSFMRGMRYFIDIVHLHLYTAAD